MKVSIEFVAEGPNEATKDDEDNLLECEFHEETPHFIRTGETFYWLGLDKERGYDYAVCSGCLREHSKGLD
jgi:hypothetical protein